MASDGYAALMNEVEKGKAGGPRLAALGAMPADADLTGVAIGIDYRDAAGRGSRRWVTVRSIDAEVEHTMVAYCWKRRQLRTFRLDRIQDVIDGNGEVYSGEAFIDMIRPAATDRPVGRAAEKRRPSKREAARQAAGKAAVVEAIVAQREARQLAGEASAPKASAQPAQMLAGVVTAAIVLAVVAWLVM